jgi:GNAT superfamily N-acetyltransferase
VWRVVDEWAGRWTMTQPLQGFQVRSGRPHEAPALLAFFPNNPLGQKNLLLLGAFGQPGDVPLGAAIIRASRRGNLNLGHFLIWVRPECRRRQIGARLMSHLFQLAIKNDADQLTLAELIHQDRPDNAFFTAVGLSIERSFATFQAPLQKALTTISGPIAARFERSHPHLAGAQIVPLGQLDIEDVAQFFVQHYPGFVDQRLEQLASGHYDLSVSVGAVREGKLFGGALVRSKPNEPSIYLDLILVAPEFRSGPAPVVLCAHISRIGMARGYTHCVFESDERFDHFATGFAKRCGAERQWHRHRYGISRGELALRAASADAREMNP